MSDEMEGRAGQALGKMRPLRTLWQLRAGLVCAVVLTGLTVLGLSLIGDRWSWTWLAGTALPVALPVALASLGLGAAYGALRYQAYGAALHPGEGLVLRHGVWWRTESWVPIARLQHLDLQQSPLERLWGMARLELHTAGQHDHKTAVHGLPLAEAQALRSSLMPRVQGHHE
ncbi:PH domain-containing protein [Mitsuaria sp. WAJ17]|uniref:PH domain-containing protein n=1 Tax=Mitsuaria sp. WAJ17 TaxID=2761452 RepID=UPI0016004B72|nr:PH domain-containing protein [Mitsuaria sp. WAJ17]MBB2487307.1 PH domain-containing protein [Mitsuaria sp. WAJ17]